MPSAVRSLAIDLCVLLLEERVDPASRRFASSFSNASASADCVGLADAAAARAALAGAGEDAVERVVVVGRDRVELVVVAAGAGDGQAHQCRGSRRRCGRR